MRQKTSNGAAVEIDDCSGVLNAKRPQPLFVPASSTNINLKMSFFTPVHYSGAHKFPE